ncbi:putative plasminogen-binding group A steptococcal M-like protein PAM [Streptococcus pyogenes GA19681]|nr:putative plasminogen-binding group A steptococcal M-like protein PAM [Streptococcus pyogenes GA19681]
MERLKNERHEEAELERLKSERHEHDKKEAERKALEDKLADKQEHLDGALRYINEKEAERKEKKQSRKNLKKKNKSQTQAVKVFAVTWTHHVKLRNRLKKI